MPPEIAWPCAAGAAVFAVGLVTARREIAAASGIDKIIALGPVCFAAPLAVFGAEHLVSARFLAPIVPAWMPGRMFWTYFVGCALIAAAASLVLQRAARLAAVLLGAMFWLFVLSIHVPAILTAPGNRILWAVGLRDMAFAGAAWSLAGALSGRRSGSKWLVLVGRWCVAIPLIVFACEHFLHPDYVPAVPLGKRTPAWVPAPALWGYTTGVAEFVASVCLILNQRARLAAAGLGLLIILLVAFLYLPIFFRADIPQLTEAMNYVADTLLFGGAVLLVARAAPHSS